MTKFNVGDYIMAINSGEEFIVMSQEFHYSTHCFEKYELIRCRDGAKIEVVGTAINNYCLSKDFLLSGFVPSSGQDSGINLDDIEMEQVKFDDTHLKLQKMLPSKDCDHDWVTWTGLHGTQTDCSKCKEVKND